MASFAPSAQAPSRLAREAAPPALFPASRRLPWIAAVCSRARPLSWALAWMDAAALQGYGPLLLLLGLAIFNCVTGSGNTTTEHEAKRLSCSYPNGNCTDGTTGLKWRGHFSKCPEEYKHYCIKGRCRYIAVEQTPACVCERGYTGARCERLDLFYLRGDQGQIVVASLIAVMVLLIILISCTCTCTHYCRKRRRRKKEEEMGTLDKGLPIKTEDILETDIA